MDRRALPGLFGGLAGCAFAVVGAISGSPVITVVAAGCALLSGASSLTLLDRTRSAEKQAAIAAAEVHTLREMEAAAHRAPQSLVDPETGLPDGRFFELVLDTRIAAARRHLWPVAVVLLEVTPHPDHRLPESLNSFVSLVRTTLREADVVCRTGTRTFAFILEDTNEAGGVWAAERVQVATAKDDIGAKSVVAGVASYPTHGLTSDEVLDRARHALARAAASDPGRGLGSVEVATIDIR
ncbi:MAG TPA: diguanylate cyclase [Acidimicrobiales bacterium]|jgi:diguanylate cyclase (GGDEF)-like protein|nr:diguanylate cyclase [Acidimicrobiales bacterium]